METAGSDSVMTGNFESWKSMEILLADFLNRLAFLPIANIINVLHRNVDYREALRGGNSRKLTTLKWRDLCGPGKISLFLSWVLSTDKWNIPQNLSLGPESWQSCTPIQSLLDSHPSLPSSCLGKVAQLVERSTVLDTLPCPWSLADAPGPAARGCHVTGEWKRHRQAQGPLVQCFSPSKWFHLAQYP